ncbi:hypothetical protein D9757_002571 [Collybiopsis confluens]|uniref:laccase n=1 Tax=Collybiopsis confluens TaxID=2823264 RepID=A0A8H5ME58_9AGAR|nr:hypothetical protein D9757_002571 [Collybiopsis confluens]
MHLQSFATSKLLSLLALAPTSFAVLQTSGDLVISNSAVSPDGFSRTAVLAGGTVVGELITGNKASERPLLTRFVTYPNSRAIIFKSISSIGTEFFKAKGLTGLTDLAANNSFLYDFTATDQAGTFWYHSHLSTQYCDGLRGPFVIYDSDDPYADLYDVDDETTVLTLMDWYHAKAETLLFPAADATLINGLGRYSGGNATDLAVISVTQGQRYRFRLINLSCDPNFVFAIDNHTMNVIEADSVNHQPLAVDSIQIFAGQRYSFVLTANQSIDNYWIRADPSTGTSGFSGGLNSAILRYVGADDSEPGTPEVTSVLALNETQLIPLENPGAPGEPEVGGVDYALNLALAFTSSLKFTINDETFTPPTVPVLLQILSGAQTADSLLPSGSVYSLPSNSTTEISIPSGGLAGFPHPFHLHGHTFDVVRSAGSSEYNYVNPPRRDVVSTGAAGDNVTIRFTTDNPGPWFLHCHIDWHLEAGLAIVFAEDVADWNSTVTPSDAWSDLCPTYNALTADQL